MAESENIADMGSYATDVAWRKLSLALSSDVLTAVARANQSNCQISLNKEARGAV